MVKFDDASKQEYFSFIMESLVISFFLTLFLSISSYHPVFSQSDSVDHRFLSYVINPRVNPIKLYWRSENGKLIKSLGNLKKQVEVKGIRLIFATNGGMFKEDRSPVGLFIQNGKTISPVNTSTGSGNFYLKPNGVFYVTQTEIAGITTTPDFSKSGKIKYATQSGPMLVINGKIHASFIRGSVNLNIRSGVGILSDGRAVFVLSKEPVNFYSLAEYFKNIGCLNALYLDGLVSRTYLPEKEWIQTDGDFGVIIGVASQAQH